MKKITAVLLSLICIAALLTGCDRSEYKKATALFENGQYAEAAELFASLSDYEDSADRVLECNYQLAAGLFKGGDYQGAKALFSALGNYNDSADRAFECDYQLAASLFKGGDYQAAKAMFTALGNYEDSADWAMECDYQAADVLFQSGDYEGAIAIYETISAYQDASAKLVIAKQELMRKSYGDVIALLSKGKWFYSSGTTTVLNQLTFSDLTATIKKVSFDGNGRHDNVPDTYAYTIDDNKIYIHIQSGRIKEIAYSVTGSEISFGRDYLTEKQVDSDLQGHWTYTSQSLLGSWNEYHLLINGSKLKYEHAAEAYGYRDGTYYYYGPYSGSYRLKFGGFDTAMTNGSEWFWGIKDGKAVALHFDHVCSKTNGDLPGEDGYFR